MEKGNISYWYRTMGGVPKRSPALSHSDTADVCIIGGGFTGLWSAYYLKRQKPNLKIIVLEKEFCGFGASGRNGGWLSGVFGWSAEKYAQTSGIEPARELVRKMQASVQEVLTQTKIIGVNIDAHETAELSVALNPAQLERLHQDAQSRAYWGEKNLTVLTADAVRKTISIPGALGATRSHGVARINPAKLIRGLYDHLVANGVEIYEESAVSAISRGLIETDYGTVKATSIIRATEGYTSTFDGLRRDILPLNSAQIVTQRLTQDQWAKIGWTGRELLGDYANMYCYCQRTPDGRIMVGSRGTPYKFGSRFDAAGVPDAATIRQLTNILFRYFPSLKGIQIDHAWGGILGVPRDWCAQVVSDAEAGIFSAGGYVGVGVATSNLAGRTLADLVLEQETNLTALPWVNRQTRKWEPEPFRWLGVRGMYTLYRVADWFEARSGLRHSPLATLGSWITGR